MIKAVVFDIGNVLVDFGWKDYLDRTFEDESVRKELAEAMFLNSDWQEGDRLDMTYEEYVQMFVDNAPHLEKEIRYVLSHMSDFFSEYTYTRQVIREFKEEGYKVYFLSNYSHAAYDQTKEILSFTEEMDGGIFSYRENMAKPDPEFFKLFCSRFDLKPSEIVFLDDLKENVAAARMLGLQGIQVTHKMLEEEAHWYRLRTYREA